MTSWARDAVPVLAGEASLRHRACKESLENVPELDGTACRAAGQSHGQHPDATVEWW
jgi:hypothetical protein